MTKKHFIALADMIRSHNEMAVEARDKYQPFTQDQLESLAGFCLYQNRQFNLHRWIDYIAGNCGPNGGAIRKERAA